MVQSNITIGRNSVTTLAFRDIAWLLAAQLGDVRIGHIRQKAKANAQRTKCVQRNFGRCFAATG